MKKVLITGSMGQLGRALNKSLLKSNNYEIYNTDVNEVNDVFLGKVYSLNITDIEAVEKTFNIFSPDVVVNCAAHTAVDLCETDQVNAYKINVEGPKNLAMFSDKMGAKMVQISTDYIFDGFATTPYTEEMKGNPQSIYATTKYESEKIVMKYCSKSYIIRTGWMYGEGNNFIRTMLNLSEKNKEIKVVEDQYGTPTSASEVARLIVYLIETENYGLYHGTCEGSTSWYEYAVEIFKLANKNVLVKPVKSYEYASIAKRPKYSVLENKRLKEETNFQFTSWSDELNVYIESLMNKKQG